MNDIRFLVYTTLFLWRGLPFPVSCTIFRHVREVASSYLLCLSHPSVGMYRRSSHRTDFFGIWYWGLLWKSVKKIQIELKSYRHIGHLTWRPKGVSYCWQWRVWCNCAQKVLLHFHGSAFTVYFIVDRNICMSKIQRISMVTIVIQMHHCIILYIHCPYIYIYTGCNRRNVRDFGRVFLRSNYTDITQNTYIQSWMVTEIMAIEMCGLLGCRRTVRLSWCHTCPMRLPGMRHGNAVTLASALQSAAACGKVLGSLRTTMTQVRVFL